VPAGTQVALPLRSAEGDDRHDVLVVTSRSDSGQRLFADFDVPVAAVESRPISRTSLRAAAGGVFGNVRGIAQALPLVSRFKPEVVIGAGGYASVPVVAAAGLLRTAGLLRHAKIVLMNPDVAPGLANRSLAPVADEVWCAFDATARHFPGKFVLTGTPVRPEFYALPQPADARKRLGLDPGKTTILAFGGSQGARSLNVAVSAMVARRRLPVTWQVLHIAGERDHAWMAAERAAESNGNRYVLLPYLAEMALAYAAADLAVCRAGASTLAELVTTGTPSVLVPYPFAAEDHQRKNAEALRIAGAARVLDDGDLDADSLYWALVEAVTDDTLSSMRAAARGLSRPRALHDMVERILLRRIGETETSVEQRSAAPKR
jgi:UDP-N-acetylglucosamine--N-acetylmuramyl-(pentapeptide) pyrophosphoryl-undecaprenol N-acetylglucosamine transferase